MEIKSWYFATPGDKPDTMLAKLKSAQPGKINLFVIHVGIDRSEMSIMEDLDLFGPKEMSKYRNGELNKLMAPQFQQLLHDPKYRLLDYQILTEEKGLETMKRPAGN